MKRTSPTTFTDQINDNTSILVDCDNNRAIVKHEDKTQTYQYLDDIKISDYEKLRNQVDNKYNK